MALNTWCFKVSPTTDSISMPITPWIIWLACVCCPSITFLHLFFHKLQQTSPKSLLPHVHLLNLWLLHALFRHLSSQSCKLPKKKLDSLLVSIIWVHTSLAVWQSLRMCIMFSSLWHSKGHSPLSFGVNLARRELVGSLSWSTCHKKNLIFSCANF